MLNPLTLPLAPTLAFLAWSWPSLLTVFIGLALATWAAVDLRRRRREQAKGVESVLARRFALRPAERRVIGRAAARLGWPPATLLICRGAFDQATESASPTMKSQLESIRARLFPRDAEPNRSTDESPTDADAPASR